jgi:hypothetical protein
MRRQKTFVVAGSLVLAWTLGACGGGSSSTASAGGSDAPTDASKASFCASFDKLSSHTSPKEAADTLSAVGTPSDIGATARHGFEVLVERLRQLPPKANKGDITQMARELTGADQAAVIAFISYYAGECQGLPTDAPS